MNRHTTASKLRYIATCLEDQERQDDEPFDEWFTRSYRRIMRDHDRQAKKLPDRMRKVYAYIRKVSVATRQVPIVTSPDRTEPFTWAVAVNRQKIAGATGLVPRSVDRALADLIEAGWLKPCGRPGVGRGRTSQRYNLPRYPTKTAVLGWLKMEFPEAFS